MKKNKFFIYLLFLFLLLSSCSNSYSNYKRGQYDKALAFFSSNKNPNTNDFYAKTMSLYSLDKKEDAKSSSLIYLLMAEESENRRQIAETFIDYKASDYLNIIALKPTDGIKAQIALYKSYLNLNQLQHARSICENYLANSLYIADFVTLLVNFPFDLTYTANQFSKWSESLKPEDTTEFLELMVKFSKSEINEECAKILINTSSKYSNLSSQIDLSNCYWIIGNSLKVLNDTQNAKKYWTAAYKLNKNNEELRKLVEK